MKYLLLMVALFSCGKNNHTGTDDCATRKRVVFACVRRYVHNYGIDYAINYCNQRHNKQECFQ